MVTCTATSGGKKAMGVKGFGSKASEFGDGFIEVEVTFILQEYRRKITKVLKCYS